MKIKIKDLVKVVSNRAILIALTFLLASVEKTKRTDGTPLTEIDLGTVILKYMKQMVAELAEAQKDAAFVEKVLLNTANLEKEVGLEDVNIHE